MADDNMKTNDLNKNLGGKGTEDEAARGAQTPGRNPKDDQTTGQRPGGDEPRTGDDMDEGHGGRQDQGSQRR